MSNGIYSYAYVSVVNELLFIMKKKMNLQEHCTSITNII